MAPPVFLITGQLAAGKSTVAAGVLQHYERGVHVDVDAIREMVVSGHASPLQPGDEVEHQFRLALVAASRLAKVYHEAGFVVAVEGAFDPDFARQALIDAGLAGAIVGVQLVPDRATALQRNRDRTTKPFDPAILEDAIGWIDDDLSARPSPAGYTRIDNSAETAEATIARVLSLAR